MLFILTSMDSSSRSGISAFMTEMLDFVLAARTSAVELKYLLLRRESWPSFWTALAVAVEGASVNQRRIRWSSFPASRDSSNAGSVSAFTAETLVFFLSSTLRSSRDGNFELTSGTLIFILNSTVRSSRVSIFVLTSETLVFILRTAAVVEVACLNWRRERLSSYLAARAAALEVASLNWRREAWSSLSDRRSNRGGICEPTPGTQRKCHLRCIVWRILPHSWQRVLEQLKMWFLILRRSSISAVLAIAFWEQSCVSLAATR